MGVRVASRIFDYSDVSKDVVCVTEKTGFNTPTLTLSKGCIDKTTENYFSYCFGQF